MWVASLVPAGAVLLLDQASKIAVLSRQEPDARAVSRSGPRIRLVENVNIGLGLIRDRRVLVAVWSAAVLGTGLILQYVPPLQSQVAHLGCGVALGGATGNLLDACRRGAVVDFIDLRVWPVFNLADAAIVAGLAVVLWSLV